MALKSENFTGNDCSGSDGEKNRVLTLSNSNKTLDTGFLVFLDGNAVVNGTHYSVNHKYASSEITFSVAVWDSQNIIIHYYVDEVPTGPVGLTKDEFRKVTHFSKDYISDGDLNFLLNRATDSVKKVISSLTWLEKTEGDIDGSNKEFKVKNTPIADANLDKSYNTEDVDVFFAKYDDSTNFIEYGTKKNISNIQDKEGIITVDTSPTSTTAEAGVFVTYRTWNKTDLSYDQIFLAIYYYCAYLVKNKLEGTAPDFNLIGASYLRRDAVGGDWLKKCYDILGVENYVNFQRAEGSSI